MTTYTEILHSGQNHNYIK